MQRIMRALLTAACAGALVSQAAAQPPAGDRAETRKEKSKDFSKSSIVTRMMACDKNKDGKLTRDEVTDTRLRRLFDRADANKDGVVTKEELMALAAQLEAEFGRGDERGRFGGPGGGGPGGFDGPGGFGRRGRGSDAPGGPGGPGMGGPPQPGQIMPSFLQERLNLTAVQKQQLEGLQKEGDGKPS